MPSDHPVCPEKTLFSSMGHEYGVARDVSVPIVALRTKGCLYLRMFRLLPLPMLVGEDGRLLLLMILIHGDGDRPGRFGCIALVYSKDCGCGVNADTEST